MGTPVQIVGHRGNALQAPENTRVSITQAIAAGASVVEMDARLTRDGQVVLMHDDTVDRTTGGTGFIAEMSLAQVQKLDAGSWKNPKYRGEHVPTLSQAAEVCRGKAVMMLDLKCPGQGPALARWMRDSNYPADQLILAPWDVGEGVELRQHLEDPAMVLIVEKTCPPVADDYFSQLTRSGFSGFSIEWPVVTPPFIAAARKHGMNVFTWTINDPAEARRAAAAGVHGIITDDPAAIIAAL